MNQTIYIVEDDSRISTLITKNLESAGFTCRQFENGLSVLEAFRESEPSLFVLDVMLPGIDGIELTRRVRKVGRVRSLSQTWSPSCRGCWVATVSP